MRARIRHSEAGISLQEILVAMAILGIIMVFTVPNFNAYMKVLRGQTEMNQVVGALNLGRQMAVTSRDNHVFLLNADPVNTWQLINSVTSNVVESGTFPDGVTAQVAASFQFDSSGACLFPTIYSGGIPDSQYLQVEALIQGSTLDRYILEVAPTGKIKSTRERVDS